MKSMTLRGEIQEQDVANSISRLFPGRTWAGSIRLVRTKGSNIDICGKARDPAAETLAQLLVRRQ
jgi:hypothetical protein